MTAGRVTTWAEREPGLAAGAPVDLTTARTVKLDGFDYSTTAPPERYLGQRAEHYRRLAEDAAR